MKKLIFTVVTCLILSLASCGSSADYEAIHKKLERDEQPTAADYSAMATYVEECVDEMKSMKGTKKDTPEGFTEFEKNILTGLSSWARSSWLRIQEGSLTTPQKKSSKRYRAKARN